MPRLESMIAPEVLAARIAELGAELSAKYAGETVIVVGVLKGSFLFMADLIRSMEGDLRCHFLGVASYEGTSSTGKVRITHDLDVDIQGAHVLVVEDIVDTGLTLAYIRDLLRVREPRSLSVVALLDKPERRQVEVEVEHVGFTIPDVFVVGYGLDLDQRYRHLPSVCIFHPDGA